MRQLAKTLLRLNVETRSFHAGADEPWLDLIAMRDTVTRFDYVQHLVQRYGFDAPLEAAIAYTPLVDSFVDTHSRFRAGAIAKDLLVLGVTPGEVANLRQCLIAPFNSVAEALGWLYVHQRSTLLHAQVLGELSRRIPEIEPATSYLRGNAGHIGNTWDDFGQALDHVARTPATEQAIITAAKDAFRTAIDWYARVTGDTRRTKPF